MAKKQIDLGLTGLDELFMDDRERAESKLPKIHEIPLSEIDEFPNHPFHVRLDEDMDQLVESIKERGIITPVTLRQKPDGRYEIVSGHRRTKACELAGLATVKAEIKELSRDEAIILMVESNLQRTTILPSEKAFSYKMRLEAMNRQAHSSYVCTDPKGTLLPEIGAFLERKKYRIKCLNLINFRKSMKYNPLAYIRSEKDFHSIFLGLDRKGWIAAVVGVVGMCVNCQNCEAVGKLFADLWEKACLFPSGCEWLFHQHERQFSIFP